MENESLKSIGKRVRLARVSLDMSQTQVAQEGGPSRPTISRIERGEPVESLDSQLQRLSLVLRTPIAYFTEGTVIPSKPMHPHGIDLDKPPVDLDLLAAILESIEVVLAARKVKLPPKVFATLVVTIYDAAQQEATLRQDLPNRIQPFIRLALAGAG